MDMPRRCESGWGARLTPIGRCRRSRTCARPTPVRHLDGASLGRAGAHRDVHGGRGGGRVARRLAGPAGRCRAHAHRRRRAGAVAAHRLDRAASRRPLQDLRVPPLGDPGRPGERRGAVRHRGVGRGRGGAAHPAPGAGSGRSLPRRRRRGAGRQPREPGGCCTARGREASTPAAPTSTSWATRSDRSERSPPPAIIALTGWTVADPLVSMLLSLLILIGAWRLMRESTDILLESCPPARLPRRGAGAAAGGARRVRGARPPRLDRHQRHGGDERPRGGARASTPTRACWRVSGPKWRPWASVTSRFSSRWLRTAARGCDDARTAAAAPRRAALTHPVTGTPATGTEPAF